jgi:hypothetical protein
MKRSLEILDERLEFEPTEPFWRTHPKLRDRIAAAGELIKKENQNFPASGELQRLSQRPGAGYSLQRDGKSGQPPSTHGRRACADAGGLEPDDAVNRTLLADPCRRLGAKTAQPQESELSLRSRDQARHHALKLTEEAEQKVLLKSPSRAATLQSNPAKAEALYCEAIVFDPALPDAHWGSACCIKTKPNPPRPFANTRPT